MKLTSGIKWISMQYFFTQLVSIVHRGTAKPTEQLYTKLTYSA